MGWYIPIVGRAARFAVPDSQPLQLPRGHIPALDGIRGLAILLVTAYRFAGPHDESTPGWALPLIDLGNRGVDLFFVLSGFLITGILFDAKGQASYFRNFYARRTLRIFPLYYTTLFVVLVLLPLLGISTAWLKASTTDLNSLWLYGSNLMMSHRGEWNFGGLNHFWSLCVEEHFYLVWPLVIFALSRTNAMRLCIGLFCLSAGSRIAWILLGGTGPATEVFTLFRLDSLCAGAWIALAARGPNGLGALLPAARSVLLVSGLLLLRLVVLRMRLMTIPTTLFACFFAAFILLAVASAKQGILSCLGRSSFLQWFGRYSYGMYVYQNLLLYGLASVFTAQSLQQLTGSALFGRLGFMLVMSLLTCGLAWLSWHSYEKRLLAFKHLFESKRPTVPLEQIGATLPAKEARVAHT
ncbi:O-acetyltransferase OatA [Anatilimnocola aggregata]|uniref:O-acetyltransferase OatA n=1 Tax=Anatilimnocola aggregata TaxID=2528021 RepID=A0A517Y8U6_9BACT|nr:acyltransferase [Anatilimnocola aggregata]QDU26664.1 O-acetyltransferase OatA [Anatilimnocola aggregata]